MRESSEPVRRPILRQGEAKEETQRLSGFGGEIGKIDPQGFARDRARGIIGKEMHAGDDDVLGQDDLVPRRRPHHCGVIAQPKRALSRQWRKIGRDQLVF